VAASGLLPEDLQVVGVTAANITLSLWWPNFNTRVLMQETGSKLPETGS
jgi:hypothetical protein